jgi:hypothetical protein
MEETQKPESEKLPTVVEAAAKEAHAALVASFGGKMCPLLSIGGMRAAPASPLVGANGMGFSPTSQDGEALGCQGPNCQWFILTGANKFGHANAGACAVGVLPSAIIQLGHAMNEQAKAITFTNKFPKHKG